MYSCRFLNKIGISIGFFMYLVILQRLLLEAVLDIFYFPLWWYTGGVKHALFWCFNLFKDGNRTLAPGLWFRNIFVPMYGQYDWQGRIISFFIRLANVIGRMMALGFWFGICITLFAVWFIFPVIIIYGLISSFMKI